MSAHNMSLEKLPWWSWLSPALAFGLLGLEFALIVHVDSALVLVLTGLLVLATVFAAVHHAEILALRVGEPFGSILLAIAVTVIEVALIASIFLSPTDGAETVARDTVYSAAMIVLNGVVGLCLLAGGKRYHEQAFQLHGAAAALAVLSTLATLTLVLPNYTLTIRGPYYSAAQLIVVGAVSLILYGVFVFVQTVRHRDYFLVDPGLDAVDHGLRPPRRVAVSSALLLILCLVGVIFLAKSLSAPLTEAVVALRLPLSLVGVVIAGIVLLPEAAASLRAAWANQIQNSLNLALGSALASIGLTIPALSAMSLLTGKEISLGLAPAQQVLLALTLVTSILTLGTGRSTVLQGAVHLAIFCVFLLLEVAP